MTHQTGRCYYIQISGLPDIITTVVTSQPLAASAWVRDVQTSGDRAIIGFDIHQLQGAAPQSSVLQLCVGHRCLVYQLSSSEPIPASITEFLSKPNNVFVGMDIIVKVPLLHQYNVGINGHFKELGKLASRFYERGILRQASLEVLSRYVLGTWVKRSVINLNVQALKDITPVQIHSCALNVYSFYTIGHALSVIRLLA